MDEFSPQAMMRKYWPLFVLSAGVLVIVAIGDRFGGEQLQTTLIEMLIRMIVVVAMQLFIGNSGVLSFGHIGFMCIGAYTAAWATCEPNWKQLMLTGLPNFMQTAQWPFPVDIIAAGVLSALVALLYGAVVIRLSGIAASIATFAFLAIINSVYSNWETVTAGTSSIIGIPTLGGPWPIVVFVLLTMLGGFLFQNSRFGLMLRASRDDDVAATSCAVDVVRVRLVAFVVSAFFVGVGGGLYAHFLGVLTVDVFYFESDLHHAVDAGGRWPRQFKRRSGGRGGCHRGRGGPAFARSRRPCGIGSLRVARRFAGNRSRPDHGVDPGLSSVRTDAQPRDSLAVRDAANDRPIGFAPARRGNCSLARAGGTSGGIAFGLTRFFDQKQPEAVDGNSLPGQYRGRCRRFLDECRS